MAITFELDHKQKSLLIATIAIFTSFAAAAYSNRTHASQHAANVQPIRLLQRDGDQDSCRQQQMQITRYHPRSGSPCRPSRLRQFRKFALLPVEIREIIYEHAMRQGGTFALPIVPASSAKPEKHSILTQCLPALCYTSRNERAIGISVFVRNAAFQLYREGDAEILACWLELMSNGYDFRSIRQMDIFHSPQTRLTGLRYDVDLVKRCPGLRKVTITLPLERLCISRPSRSRPGVKYVRACTYSEILSRFQFAGILECSSLRKLTVLVSSNLSLEEMMRATPVQVYDNVLLLLSLMERGFEKRHGRRIVMIMACLYSIRYKTRLIGRKIRKKQQSSLTSARAAFKILPLFSTQVTTEPGTRPASCNLDRDLTNMCPTPPDYGNNVTKGVEEEKLSGTDTPRCIKFTDLPVEIKEKIYEHTLPSNLYYDVDSSILVQREDYQGSLTRPSHLPAICYISSLERKIGLRIFLRTATMIYRNADIEVMRRCLDQAASNGKLGLALVTKLGILSETRIDKKLKSLVTVVEQFPALRGVAILFYTHALSEAQFDLIDFCWKYPCHSSSTILARYDLMRLVECSRLKRIDIGIRGEWSDEEPEEFYSVIETVASHIKQEFFRANSREVEIKVDKAIKRSGERDSGEWVRME
ncbi:hypothetical protein BKA63DRAFT_549948 [Paraphoma chrysanthemicola]|nr:hypothetical protein BKA63DRAFT_549948 [Paraphoma chrysanthemicola]